MGSISAAAPPQGGADQRLSLGGWRIQWQRLGRGLDLAVVGFWALVVGLSLANNLSLYASQAEGVALARARMLFSVVENVRLWNSRHGGVYVKADAETPPNAYLDGPQRDLTVDGTLYTKVNPAYMTRQLSELVRQNQGVSFHITSLKPINPDNRPDSWEAAMLGRFEAGEREVITHIADGPVRGYRYMAALSVDSPCLQCHRKQGYQVGDVRGGISVSIPEHEVMAELAPQRQRTILVHGMAFILFSLISLGFLQHLRRHWAALVAAREVQERIVAERTAELRRSNEDLEQFAYVASHDLRQPLRMVSSYLALLRRRTDGRLDDEAKEFLGFALEGAQRMDRLVVDLLGYCRLTTHGAAFAPVALDPVLAVALTNLGLDGEVVRTEPLPQVDGDEGQLVRLLQNLIGNAVKYRRPDVPPRVLVSAIRRGDQWEIAVADNGIGIPPEHFGRIFQVFQRLHAANEYEGTGIGLAQCKKIVERHGGRIWVESAPGEGSTFRFTLRCAADKKPD